jgi:hypothetical protein
MQTNYNLYGGPVYYERIVGVRERLSCCFSYFCNFYDFLHIFETVKKHYAGFMAQFRPGKINTRSGARFRGEGPFMLDPRASIVLTTLFTSFLIVCFALFLSAASSSQLFVFSRVRFGKQHGPHKRPKFSDVLSHH